MVKSGEFKIIVDFNTNLLFLVSLTSGLIVIIALV